MNKRSYARRIGGLVTVWICLFGILLTRYHNIYVDILCGCVALATFTIFAAMRCRRAGPER